MISGKAGGSAVGRPRPGRALAHQVRDRFGDGQLYVNLRGHAHGTPVRPIEALARFLRAHTAALLGVPACSNT